ncbi:TMV resistance protein N-like [Pyrus ussuriensis x Pyrus communis]|uniref:TMV resistance protein N-like n=1 Tax=Pyrus ussuriensis x Pyrus communis TaxID=2448454 RepID=A0A5N5GIR6_9ROSA|nr:TMV resistance protein N-like [Pyrus ussuriensis x Pyrus communis]
MAQIFRLRPSDRIVDVTHDWAPLSLSTAESSGSSAPLLQLEYKSATLKSYGTFFKDEKTIDALIFQEVVLFGDSKAKVEPKAKTRAPKRARTIVTSKTSKTSTASIVVALVVGMKKQTTSTTKKPITVSLDDPLGVEMQQRVFVEGSGLDSPPLVITPPPPSSKAPSSTQGSGESPPCLILKRDLPRPSFVSGVTEIPIPRLEKKRAKIFATTTSIPTPEIKAAPSVMVEGVRDVPPASSISSLLNLVKKIGQIKTKLRSPSSSSESPLLQNARQIFKDWVKRDFTASFSPKTLYDAEKALIELFKAQLLSKAQYKSFLNFFENLWALRDQHHKAERASNRVKCFQEKHVKSTATLQ